MLLHVDANNGLPIYEQIARHVKFAVASGALGVGDHVPSVRELAAQIAVNANTVARAYRELQAEGIIMPIRGTGLAITPDAPKACRAARQQMIRDRLRLVLEEAHRAGVEGDEIRTLVDKELKRLGGGAS
jgi:GntR family transcriptional regulator